MTIASGSDGWYVDSVTGYTFWKYGKEVWCNLEGRYMHIVADLSHLLSVPYSFT